VTLHRPGYNPKAPHARRTTDEVQSTLDSFVERLQQLGAEPDVIEAVRSHWDDEDWDEAERSMLLAVSDTVLAGELASIDREHYEGTTTPEEEAAELAMAARVDGMLPEPAPVVIDWLHRENDVALATAVEAAEAQQRRPRSTVLAAAAEIIAAAEA
jgi:hypothetical protein